MKKIFLTVLLTAVLLAGGCGIDNSSAEIESASGANSAESSYPDIEVDAFIRERKAIIPGSSIPITIIVRNIGLKAVDYVQGSGKYETPEAVFVDVDGLQTVLPRDHLGPVTMDFITKELKPGEELTFVMYVMAIEPDSNFNTYTLDVYEDGEKYIAEKDWFELKEEFPGLAQAKSGTYQGKACFVYYLRDESGASDFTKDPSGCAERDFTITVN